MRTKRLPFGGGNDGDGGADEEEADKVGTKNYRLSFGV
jgi:hypothetical protein